MSEKIVFTRGVPSPDAFPKQELGECFDAVVREDAAIVLQYGQQSAYGPLREQLAAEYGVSESQVMIGNGSLQLQDLVSAYLIGTGSVVYTEQPSYDRAITTFRRRGARAVGSRWRRTGSTSSVSRSGSGRKSRPYCTSCRTSRTRPGRRSR